MHEAAAQGFATATAAYARGRPEYPPAIDDWLRDAVGLQAGSRVLDVGAGTGKFTRRLLALGAEVCAVEPVEAMRAELQRALPGIDARQGTAEALPWPDAAFDALVCAQAFHWFANAQALAELHRVLRPGGRLALVWNVRDESVDWVQDITRLITPYEGDTPRYHSGAWRRVFEGQPLFDEPVCSVLAHIHDGPFEHVVVDRFLSVSFIAALPPAEREQVAARLRALPASHVALRDARVVVPYRTEAWLATRQPRC